MLEKRFLTLKLAPASGHRRASPTLTFPVVFVGNEPRHRQSFICSTGEAGSDSSDSSTSDSTPASIAEQLGSAAGAECPTASRRLQTCKSACGQSASTVSKATSSTISSEASEKRNRTASQQHTLIRYRDECSRACSVLCAVFVASVLAILSLPRGDAQIQEAEGFSFS